MTSFLISPLFHFLLSILPSDFRSDTSPNITYRTREITRSHLLRDTKITINLSKPPQIRIKFRVLPTFPPVSCRIRSQGYSFANSITKRRASPINKSTTYRIFIIYPVTKCPSCGIPTYRACHTDGGDIAADEQIFPGDLALTLCRARKAVIVDSLAITWTYHT